MDLISSRRRRYSRLTNEAPARVFHQGPGNKPNMAVCSSAVLHLLAQRTPWNRNWIRKNDELKNYHAHLRNRGSPCSRANRRCAALSRSVQRPKGARLSAGLDEAATRRKYSSWPHELLFTITPSLMRG